MSLFRKIFIVGLLGLLFGTGAGVGYVIWQKQKTERPLPQLLVRCSGGTTPVVLVSWPSELDAAVPGLQRSDNQSEWKNVSGAESVKSGQGHFVDLSVQPDTRYQYRMLKDGLPVSGTVQITTNQASCRNK